MSSVATLPAAGRRIRWSSWIWRIALVVGIALVVAYLGLSAYMATVSTQAKRAAIVGTPADVGLTFESVSFTSTEDDIPLKGWFMPANSQRAIIFVHGLDGNRWSTQDPASPTGYKDYGPSLARDYVKAGFNVLMYDSRGAGESGGDRLGLGWYERRDVAGAVKYLESRGFKPASVGLHGGSYGAATAILASAVIPDIGAVVADSAFADSRELLDQEINRRTGLPPIFTPGIVVFTQAFYGLNLNEIPPIRHVAEIAPRPTFFLHCDTDKRIPVDNSIRLNAAAGKAANELWILSGCEHTKGYQQNPAEFDRRVIGFMDKNLR